MSAERVTLADCIDAGIVLGISARQTLRHARALGFRVRTADFMAAWQERRVLWLRRKAS